VTSASSLIRTGPAKGEGSLGQIGLRRAPSDYLVALAGNPNTGKSTVFNSLTGLRQHTGNWPGKTVTRAEGTYEHAGRRVQLVDLPGTYSLQAASTDEEVARDFVLFGRPDVTVIVVDATRLERNLNLVLQVLEITDRAVVCLNLMDEARRRGIAVDAGALAAELNVPVVATAARHGEGLPALLAAIDGVATGAVRPRPLRVQAFHPDIDEAVETCTAQLTDVWPALPSPRWVALRLLSGDERIEAAVRDGALGGLAADSTGLGAGADARARLLEDALGMRWRLAPTFHDALIEGIYAHAHAIAERCVVDGPRRLKVDLDPALDRMVTSRWLGFPLMLAVLAVVFWITIAGANVPSRLLAHLLIDTVHPALAGVAAMIGTPAWLSGLTLDGVYLATAWVVSVMLPPMAIFFPLFTLLEDSGYLPRVAFNLDPVFRRCGAHGKQALTMCMGFGCNAAGVVATRVIDSPRERLIAIITNTFSLCNGRWPTQILVASIFIGAIVPANLAGLASASAVVGIAVLGIGMMFLSSWFLSRTLLRGEASTFSLELPPYRPPRVLQTLYASLIDRTLIVLWRAIVFAAPAGAVIWLSANIHVGGPSLAEHAVTWLNPFGLLVGLNGVILVAYLVAIPANEIVVPTILMLTVLALGDAGVGRGAGVMFELDSARAVGSLLTAGGWTLLTAVNLLLFSLLHNPCSTTIYTIYKETHSVRWTTVATAMPLLMGFVVCFLVAQVWRLLA